MVAETTDGSQKVVLPLVVIAFGALILLLAAAEEPYHIDELRQTRHYDKAVERVVEESRGQEQPPLDPVLNALVQRIVGVGDVRQRALSVGFAIGSLVGIWILMKRSGSGGNASAAALGVMAVTPALIVVSAYARPYALPLFLMITFLVVADIWITDGSLWAAMALVAVGLILPWSRTVEPVIFLMLIAGAAAVLFLLKRGSRRRLMALGSAALLGLLSAVPALIFVSKEVSDRTSSDDALAQHLRRLISDIPSTIGQAIPYWPVVLMLLMVVLARKRTRSRLFSLWWWWILLGTAVGFAMAFAVVAPLEQPFYQRYVFTWVAPIAVLVGVALSKSHMPDTSNRLIRFVGGACVVVLLTWASALTWVELSRATNSDWERVSGVLVEDLPVGTEIIFDAVTSLGSYRTPFAGYPRYTEAHDPIPLTLSVIREPEIIDGGSNTAVVLVTADRYDVPGWQRVSIDTFFAVYLPLTPRPGREGAALSAEEFGKALGPRAGAALRLTAAALWLDIGEQSKAKAIIETLLADPDQADQVRSTTHATALAQLVAP